MAAGDRQYLVVVEKATYTKNSMNEQIATWDEFCQAWVSAEAKRGREFFENGQRYEQTVMRFGFDFHDAEGVTSDMRIVFEGGYYAIKQVLPDYARRQETVVEATTARAGANY